MGAETQSILPVPVCAATPSTITTGCHTCPVTLMAQDSLLLVLPLPAQAGHAGSPPWCEAGQASWGKGVSCSFREDLYSLLIDFFAYSPTGAALFIFCTPLGTGLGFQRCTVAKISVC